MSDWNPLYLRYARAHGKGPEEMLAYDRERFPGGVNAGFVQWVPAQFEEFLEKEKGLRYTPKHDRYGIVEQTLWEWRSMLRLQYYPEFYHWLLEKYPEEASQ